MRLLVNLARIQGVYFLLSGVWPLADINSFMAVTGPKTDLWLVRTVGVLVASIGVCLLVQQAKRHIDWAVIFMCITAGGGMAIIEIVNALTMRVPAIYFADAFLEAIFCTAWLVGSLRLRKHHRHNRHHAHLQATQK